MAITRKNGKTHNEKRSDYARQLIEQKRKEILPKYEKTNSSPVSSILERVDDNLKVFAKHYVNELGTASHNNNQDIIQNRFFEDAAFMRNQMNLHSGRVESNDIQNDSVTELLRRKEMEIKMNRPDGIDNPALYDQQIIPQTTTPIYDHQIPTVVDAHTHQIISSGAPVEFLPVLAKTRKRKLIRFVKQLRSWIMQSVKSYVYRTISDVVTAYKHEIDKDIDLRFLKQQGSAIKIIRHEFKSKKRFTIKNMKDLISCSVWIFSENENGFIESSIKPVISVDGILKIVFEKAESGYVIAIIDHQ